MNTLKKTHLTEKAREKRLRIFSKSQAFVMLAILLFHFFAVAGETPKTPKFPGTPAKFENHFFKRKTNKPKIKGVPFTEAEMRKVAPGKFSNDGMVTITKRTRYREQDSSQTVKVPVAEYLKELNTYESFLNQMGETLRDGKLKKDNPIDTRIKKDLGVLLTLRDKDKIADPTIIKNPPRFIVFDPKNFTPFIPYDPLGIFRPNERLKINPGSLIKTSPNTSTNPLTRPNLSLNRQTSIADSFKSVAGRKMRVANGLTEIGYGIGETYGGTVLRFTNEFTPSSGCGSKPKEYLFKDILKEPGDTCGAGGASVKNEINPADICPEFKPAADDPTCLYDGSINASKPFEMGSIRYHTNGGGNGWFSGYANFNLLARIQQQGKTVEMENSGIGDIGIELLGSKIPLIEASNYYSYKSGDSDAASKLTVKALPDFFDNLTLQSNFAETIKGPETTFFVGPVPITISSGFDVDLGLFPNSSTFKNFPDNCTSPEVGSLNMFLGPKARADVWLKAAINAVVASAGIKGKLILVNDEFGASLATEINPSANRVTFKPKLGYKFQHLAGGIFLFVELDLLIYSKEWSVEIISFDGFTSPNFPDTTEVLLPKEPLVISSKKNQ